MKCPHCQREQPMSFKCRFCGEALVRQSAPPRSASSPPPARPAPPATAPDLAPDVNPYAAPAARDEYPLSAASSFDDTPLAGRGARLGAALLDTVLFFGALFPGWLLVTLADIQEGQEPTPAAMVMVAAGGFLVLAGLVGLLIYQLLLLARNGQTWGKKIMNVRIVMYDTGVVPGLGRSVGLRAIVNGIFGAIPCVGGIYSLVDILFIFGPERRCLHDMIAGTKVVEAL